MSRNNCLIWWMRDLGELNNSKQVVIEHQSNQIN